MAFIRINLRRRRGDRGGEGDDGEEEGLMLYDGYSSSEEEESNGSEDEERQDEAVGDQDGKEYDISLPAQHLYLGDMEEESVASVQEEETTPTLPLHYISKHVLFPEETLPLHIYNPHVISMLREASASRKPIAVCTDMRGGEGEGIFGGARRPGREELAEFGTTADIVAFREDEGGSMWFHGPRFVVKLRGRQRFKLLEVNKKMNGMMDCRVEILPDILLLPRPPLLLSLPPCVASSYNCCLAVARQPEATPLSLERAARCRRELALSSKCMSSCRVPEWTLRLFEFDHLRDEVIEAQRVNSLSLNDKGVDPLPNDITSLSYWLSRRLPVDEKTKLEFLSINCPTKRLMLGLRLLKENTELYCSECGILITQKQYIFSMSVDGPLASYVNEGGFVHETLTVTESYNLKKSGRPTTENSWFPGYQWTILYCSRCRDHKGWSFDAVKKDLVPLKFYGLRRPGLVFSVKKPSENES
ncbi:PREDICTED: protein cereblon-like [Amphimedon queenslandica]|uniref:Protein cereblon n=1 Tax=Amphimedon queenslandica TaxID=400682 RepID=A0A1X7VQP3_AMPQE|nr:PREDICTED: protein cereblon-like [Amphimedon queenslandica]|eukprot:XP_019855683.1 PREDICTED: protein cereblon-like [Amphimedon queenslandica]